MAQARKLPTSKRYEFGDPIGDGGAGTVYRARCRETGRAVAVKVLKQSLAENETQHQRLAQEFRAATQLEHPNIVRALEMETDGRTSFLVYELIDGVDLTTLIQQSGRLSEDAAVRVVTQVAQALHYAHARQVVHRDVKPDNILVRPDGRAKLTDFGLAKDYNHDLDLTRAASGLGTPNYMAPEQFADAKSAGPACDVYSLGATLYAAVTGLTPFPGKTPLAILALKEKANELPSARAAAPDVSPRVDAAIRAALHPDAAARPASCLDFFRLLIAPRRAAAGPAPPGADDRRAGVRHPLVIGTRAGVDTAVAAGGEEAEELWPLVVRDVSAGGIGVLLARRFEAGTELTVEFAADSAEARRVPVRVARVEPAGGGHWVHGCAFPTPLAADDLAALLRLA